MDILTMIMACSLYRDNAITHAMVQIGSIKSVMSKSSILKWLWDLAASFQNYRDTVAVYNPVCCFTMH